MYLVHAPSLHGSSGELDVVISAGLRVLLSDLRKKPEHYSE